LDGVVPVQYHDIAQNHIWLAIAALAADLLAWASRLALHASAAIRTHTAAATLHILTVARRIVRVARQRLLRSAPPVPGADVITNRVRPTDGPASPLKPPTHASTTEDSERQPHKQGRRTLLLVDQQRAGPAKITRPR